MKEIEFENVEIHKPYLIYYFTPYGEKKLCHAVVGHFFYSKYSEKSNLLIDVDGNYSFEAVKERIYKIWELPDVPESDRKIFSLNRVVEG